MENSELQNLMNMASTQILDCLTNGLKDAQGVRLEDAIAAAASMAGSYLLRNCKVDLSTIEPGMPVLVDEVNEQGPKLLVVMQQNAELLGLRPKSGWTGEIPEVNLPRKTCFAYVSKFDAEITKILVELKIPRETWPGLLSLTAIQLVADGKSMLNEDVGKALVLNYVVAGSKTAPPTN